MKDPPIPPTLPRDQWRKDKEGRTMTHQCRYCGQWHYDMDCKKCPESYHITMSLDQWPSQDGPQITLDSGSDSDESFDHPSSSTSFIINFASWQSIPMVNMLFQHELMSKSREPKDIELSRLLWL